MGVLKLRGRDYIFLDDPDNKPGIAGDVTIAQSDGKLSFFDGTQNIKTAVADLAAWSPGTGLRILNAPGLAIGTAKAKVLIANTTYFVINGVLCSKATAEIVLAGTTATTKYVVYQLTIRADGTVTVTKSADAATLAAVVFPTVPDSEACLGFVIVHPTGTGSFVGGTTELDDATVVPNAVYVDTVGWSPQGDVVAASLAVRTKVQALLDALQSYNLV